MIGIEEDKQAEAPSNLFLVRVRNIRTDDEEEWCGRVQHVISGKAYTFHSLETLVELMVAMQHQVNIVELLEGGCPEPDKSDGQPVGGGMTSYPLRHKGLCS
jgi:hypothetical protein